MTLDVRFVTESDIPAFRRAVVRAFGADDKDDPKLQARWDASFKPELCIGAFDDDRLVGTFSSFDLELNVPGGSAPMAGTTIVSVMPTHRRRGLLSRMMHVHLRQAIDRGQPIAGLWATEHGIYRRFGYGVANTVREVGFDTRKASVPGPEPGVSLRTVEADEGAAVARSVFNDALAGRPGTYDRPDWWWTHRVELDHPEFRDGKSEHRWVVAEADGELVGYVLYRVKLHWDSAGPNGKLDVIEVLATTDAAERALWHYISHVDLFPNVFCWNLPEDSVLPWIIDNPRQLTYAMWDGLWVRILDVAAALQSRTYMHDGSIVIQVADDYLPEVSGVFAVEITGGSAAVERSDQAPDILLDVAELGSIYLGGVRAGQLRRAARLQGAVEAVAELERLLGWSVPSWTQEIF